MKIILKLKLMPILIICSIALIYFQIYWHYWFVKFMGKYIVSTLLPIMFLFSVFIIREFLYHDTGRIKKKKVYYLLIPLLYYILFASISIFLNEHGFDDIKRFLIYISSPVVLFASILGLYEYRKNENIKFTLNVLFILSIIFSIYATITYSSSVGVSEMPVLETRRGDVQPDTGATFGVGDIRMSRYTIPGISSTTYGAFLVPLIFAGLYFRKNHAGKLRFFYFCAVLFLIYCVLMTLSRGAFISMIFGMMYIIRWKWLKFREVMFIISVFAISFLTFANLLLLRLLITLAVFIPINVSFLGWEVQGLWRHLEDPRIMTITETLSHIYEHPFFGIGMSYLIEIQEVFYGKEPNNYLSITASFGTLALICYLLFMILLSIMLHSRIKKMPQGSLDRDMGVLLCAGSFAFIMYLNFAPAEFHFIWVWFGLAAAWIRNYDNGFFVNENTNN